MVNILQQGESVQLNITLSNPLAEGYVLYYALSNSLGIHKSGSTLDGGIEDLGDGQHFVVRLSPKDTESIYKCVMEFAVTDSTRDNVKIADKAINLEFKSNKIKEVLR